MCSMVKDQGVKNTYHNNGSGQLQWPGQVKDHYGQIPGVDRKAAFCTSAILEGIGYLNGLANVGMWMSQACTPPKKNDSAYHRLFDEEDIEPASGGSSAFLFAAMLPITAVVSFVGGWRLSKSSKGTRSVEEREAVPMFESDGMLLNAA